LYPICGCTRSCSLLVGFRAAPRLAVAYDSYCRTFALWHCTCSHFRFYTFVPILSVPEEPMLPRLKVLVSYPIQYFFAAFLINALRISFLVFDACLCLASFYNETFCSFVAL